MRLNAFLVVKFWRYEDFCVSLHKNKDTQHEDIQYDRQVHPIHALYG